MYRVTVTGNLPLLSVASKPLETKHITRAVLLFQSMFFSDLHVPTRVRSCEQPTMLFPHCKFRAGDINERCQC